MELKKQMNQIQEETFSQEESAFFDNFRRHESSRLRTLIGLYKGHYWSLFFSVVFFAVKHSPVWVLPIVTANIINIAADPGEDYIQKIMINTVIILVLILQNVLTNYFHTLLYAKTIRKVECSLRSSMVRKLQQLSITYHNEMQSGRLQSKIMRDVEQIETLSSQIFISVLSIAMNVMVAFGVVISSSMTVFYFFLGTVPVAVLIMIAFKDKIKRYNKDFRKEMEDTSVRVMEMVELIPVTRAHALEEMETARMNRQLMMVARKGLQLDVLQSYFSSISWVSFQAFQVVCLAFTGYLAARGEILAGDVVMYQTYFATIVAQVSGVITLLPIISKGLESVDSVGDILRSRDIEDTRKKNKIRPVEGKISFDNVSFQYRNAEVKVLDGLSFTVTPGETVAFVGASGAGKTTILNLVIGFLKPTQGHILIDDQRLDEVNLQSFRSHIAVVPQSSILFTGTIRENITYGAQDIPDEELMKVIRAANLEELIASLPEGLDAKISEHGANLSGGQRQRISIARAFIRNPKILILDEATSALDSVSEKKIQSSIERLVKDRTTLVVAHRLSTIRNADKIAVIGQGGMLEFGTYEELMEKKGAFWALRQMQS